MKMITKTLLSLAISTMSIGGAVGLGIVANHKAFSEPMVAEASTTRAPTSGDTLYLINNKSWSTVNAYFFDGYSESWPGTSMTSVGVKIDNNNLYKITIPSGAKKVVFNNGSAQTKDIVLANSSGCNAAYADYCDGNNVKLWNTVCKISKKRLLDSVESDIGTDYISGTSWTVPSKQDYQTGYVGNGWVKSDKSTSVSGTYSNCDWETTVYSKYTSHDNWSGTINIDLRDSGWAGAAANYAVYLMNKNTYSSEVGDWSTYVTGIASGEHLVQVPYSVGFNPDYLYIFRYKPSYTQQNWDTNKTPTGDNKWGQSADIAFNSMIRVGSSVSDGKNAVYGGFPKVVRWSPNASDIMLDTVKSNGSHNAEYYSTAVTFNENQEFKVQVAPYANGDYYATYTTHSSLTTKFSGGGSSNIKAKEAGTYAIYFDSTANSIYITTVDIASADEWAQYFLDNVGCDATGVNAPTGWSDCATEYGKLSDAAKNLIYGSDADEEGNYVEQAIARYNAALASHPSLTKFIKNSSGVARSVNTIQNNTISTSNTAIVVVVVMATAAIVSFAGLYLLKKKKEN